MKTIYECFPGGKYKALTMSYDDGTEFDRRLVEIFNKNGIKGTFHVNAGLAMNMQNGSPRKRIEIDVFKELYTGHEVSCHTYTHPTIARCPITQVAQEVLMDREALEKAVGYPVRGLSYPNGSYSDEICDLLPHLGIVYSRTVTSTHGFAMPTDLLRWNPTCHHKQDLIEKGKAFLALNKSQYQYLMYVWGHSYEFDQDDNWELIESFCELMGGKDDIWYATNIEIADYMQILKRLQYFADMSHVYNPSAASAYLRVGQDIVEIPGGCQVKLL